MLINMCKFIICIVTFLLFDMVCVAQRIHYKVFKDMVHKFSFDIPAYWSISYSKKQGGIVCKPTTNAQKKVYKDCFEGIVFRLEYLNYSLDSLLEEQYEKEGENYVTSDRISNKIPVKSIKGKTWKGIRHNNTCGISCKTDGFHAAAGECQFIWFSNGTATVGISTNGRAFNNSILNRIISSFEFFN